MFRTFGAFVNHWATYLRAESAYLLTLRFFIGLGWLRAGLEKLLYDDVLQGDWLSTFFTRHIAAGDIVFPVYTTLIKALFLPNVAVLSVLVIGLELLLGFAIIGGAFTNLALLTGIFLNINFILSGVPSPSAFYLVIQAFLIVMNTGAVLGFDIYAARQIPVALLVAQPELLLTYRRHDQLALLVLTLTFFAAALVSLPFVRDYSPHAVNDPAMILVITSLMLGSTFLVAYLRLSPLAKHGARSIAVLSHATVQLAVQPEVKYLLNAGDSTAVDTDNSSGNKGNALERT